jgi:excisionase family DNA binding protein
MNAKIKQIDFANVPIAEVPAKVATLAGPEPILTIEEVAAFLKVTPAFIAEKTRSRCPNPIPAIRLGRCLRFRVSSIQAWMTASEGVLKTKRVYRRQRRAARKVAGT